LQAGNPRRTRQQEEHAGFQHEALIYAGPEQYLAGTLPFLRAGFEAGQPVLVAVGPDQTALLQRELGADAELARFLDMREVGRNPAAIIPVWRDFVDASGGLPARGIGEPVWAARSAAALEECRRHEPLLNVAFESGPSWDLLCPYDGASLDDEVLAKVAHSHPVVSREGEREESVSFVSDPDCFAGDLPPPAADPEIFGFELAGLTEVRRRVAGAAERAGMGPGEVADFVTAAGELAANSIRHGGGSGTLRLWREEERLLAEVEDRGRIEEPLVGRTCPDLSREGGRGLWLANRLCDLVQIRSGEWGTTVRLHFLGREAAYV
jgi:anti-sigma regulatory factor (Ser/Thr protein kinase)